VSSGSINDPSLPTAVVICDSFTDAMKPMLAEHFRRIVFLHTSRPDRRRIGLERPHIVIHIVAERYLRQPPPPEKNSNTTDA